MINVCEKENERATKGKGRNIGSTRMQRKRGEEKKVDTYELEAQELDKGCEECCDSNDYGVGDKIARNWDHVTI